MRLIVSIGSLCLFLLISVAQTRHAQAEDKDEDKESPVKITLYPSAPPRPALKYRLLPRRIDQIAGNAAVYYGKVTAEQNFFFNNKELSENIDRWQELPLDELLEEGANVPSDGGIDFHLDRGARCRFCDWQLPIGDVPFYTTLLPEINQTRHFSRILAANARIDIANKRYDKAFHRFQTNYALGRHVAESECIVSGLVGVGICGNMTPQILEFVQQSDSLNLYWALTTLPSPLIDMQEAVELESYGLALTYPELARYEGVDLGSYGNLKRTDSDLWKEPLSQRTPEEWRSLYHSIIREIHSMYLDNDAKPLKSEQELDSDCQKAFPLLKKILADRGMDAKKLDSMSAHEAALVYVLYSNRDHLEDMETIYHLPYPVAVKRFDAAEQRHKEEAKEILKSLEYKDLAASINRVAVSRIAKEAQTRLDREIAILRVFEALRIYGASHEGQLPKQLNDITEVPIPLDPVTGKEFKYVVNGGMASLQSPKMRNRKPLRYYIKMVNP